MSQREQSAVPVVAVVLAAGFGTRFDPNNPKQLVSVGGKPIVCWSIEAFEANPRVTDTVVVVNPQVRHAVERLVDQAGYPKVRMILNGGAERVDSTAAALDALAAAGIPGDAKILIHDAVRPFVAQSSIDGCVGCARPVHGRPPWRSPPPTRCCSPATWATSRSSSSVPDRPQTFRAQTPQAFRFSTIRRAYALAAHDPDFHPTDDTRVRRRLPAGRAGRHRGRQRNQPEGHHARRHAHGRAHRRRYSHPTPVDWTLCSSSAW